VGIATDWTALRFPAVQGFSLLHRVQTDSEAQTVSYPMGNEGPFPSLVPRSRKVELYLHSPIYLDGIVLNLLRTGKNLLFYLSLIAAFSSRLVTKVKDKFSSHRFIVRMNLMKQ
jgi:hypothetical protein